MLFTNSSNTLALSRQGDESIVIGAVFTRWMSR